MTVTAPDIELDQTLPTGRWEVQDTPRSSVTFTIRKLSRLSQGPRRVPGYQGTIDVRDERVTGLLAIPPSH